MTTTVTFPSEEVVDAWAVGVRRAAEKLNALGVWYSGDAHPILWQRGVAYWPRGLRTAIARQAAGS